MKDLSIDEQRKLDSHLLEVILLLAKELDLMGANGSKTIKYLHDCGKKYKMTVIFEEVEK